MNCPYHALNGFLRGARFGHREERKYGALILQKPLRLVKDGEVGGWGGGGCQEILYLTPSTYSLHCHHQNDSALRWARIQHNALEDLGFRFIPTTRHGSHHPEAGEKVGVGFRGGSGGEGVEGEKCAA